MLLPYFGLFLGQSRCFLLLGIGPFFTMPIPVPLFCHSLLIGNLEKLESIVNPCEPYLLQDVLFHLVFIGFEDCIPYLGGEPLVYVGRLHEFCMDLLFGYLRVFFSCLVDIFDSGSQFFVTFFDRVYLSIGVVIGTVTHVVQLLQVLLCLPLSGYQ